MQLNLSLDRLWNVDADLDKFWKHHARTTDPANKDVNLIIDICAKFPKSSEDRMKVCAATPGGCRRFCQALALSTFTICRRKGERNWHQSRLTNGILMHQAMWILLCFLRDGSYRLCTSTLPSPLCSLLLLILYHGGNGIHLLCFLFYLLPTGPMQKRSMQASTTRTHSSCCGPCLLCFAYFLAIS